MYICIYIIDYVNDMRFWMSSSSSWWRASLCFVDASRSFQRRERQWLLETWENSKESSGRRWSGSWWWWKVCCCLKARRESELAKSKMQPNSAHKVGEDLADHKVGEDFEDHSYGVGDCRGERERLFGSRERKGKLQNAPGREGKFEACIPGNHGKREFPLTPDVLVDFFGVILKGGSKHFHRKQNLALLCTILCGKTTFQPIAPH